MWFVMILIHVFIAECKQGKSESQKSLKACNLIKQGEVWEVKIPVPEILEFDKKYFVAQKM